MLMDQPQLLGLIYLALILILLGILYLGAKKYKERRFVQEVLRLVRDRTGMLDTECSILYLACTSPGFKQMNGAVFHYPGSMAIVLEGPEWFIRNKKYCWRNHYVISAEQLNHVPLHFKNTMRMYGMENRKWHETEETARFLQSITHQVRQKAEEEQVI